MARIRPIYFLISFFFIFVFVYEKANAQEAEDRDIKQIVIAADEWCPYNCEPYSDRPGFLIELARAAFSIHDIDVKYEIMNWSRAIRLTHKGRIDGALAATKEEAISEGLEYGTEPLGLSYFAFIAKKETDWVFRDINSLPEITFGIVQDYDNGPVIAEYMEGDPDNVTIQTGLDGFAKNMKLVMAGRIDAAIDDAAVASYKLMNMGIADKTKIIPLDKTPFPVAIAFKPGKEGIRLAKLLDEGIREIRRMGWMKDILAKYGLRDWRQDYVGGCTVNCSDKIN